MTEDNMFKLLKKEFEKRIKIKFSRVENTIGTSMPDTHFITCMFEGWIELKEIPYITKKGKITVPFRPGQLNWIREYIEYKQLATIYLIATIKNVDDSWIVMKGKDIQKTYDRDNYIVSTLEETLNFLCAFDECFHTALVDKTWNQEGIRIK